MRSKSLAGHEVGLARLSAKLVTLLELAYGMRIAHGLCVALPTLTQTSATYCCTNLLHFSLSDMPRANRAQGRGSISATPANASQKANGIRINTGRNRAIRAMVRNNSS